jgi:hypothetical protein
MKSTGLAFSISARAQAFNLGISLSTLRDNKFDMSF